MSSNVDALESLESLESLDSLNSLDSLDALDATLSPFLLSLSLYLTLSLKRVYLYRKLIILNEKNKSALNG